MDTDCAGSFSVCSSACEVASARMWGETVPQNGAGLACPPGTSCQAGEGECPPDIDCVGEWTNCDASCTSVYNVTVTWSGNGAVCGDAPGATLQCSPGEGLCPAINCTGIWRPCDASCEQVYVVGVPASTTGTVLGAACSAADGAVAGCAAGVDACPLNIDCEGSWSRCSSGCEKAFTVTTAQSGTGTQCPTADGAILPCDPGGDACPALGTDCRAGSGNVAMFAGGASFGTATTIDSLGMIECAAGCGRSDPGVSPSALCTDAGDFLFRGVS